MAEKDTPAGADGSGAVVAFDKAEYDKLRAVVKDVATSTSDGLWNDDGESIGPNLRAQPAAATWGAAAQIGNSVNKLASEVRTYTDTLCDKTLLEFADSVAKAAKILEETDDTASADASSS